MAKEQAYRLRRRMLIDAFGQRLGLCERHRQYDKRELRSKPQPDAGRPCALAEDRPRATHLNWFRRLELQFILWRDFRRLRKSGPIPAPDAEPSTTT